MIEGVDPVTVDKRVRCTTSKPINLTQLTEELGGIGLCSDALNDLSAPEVEIVIIVADSDSPVTESDLASAIDAHNAVFPPTPNEIIADAVQALPDPMKDLDGFKHGLTAILQGGR